MNYSTTIRRKVKRCHWPLKAAEADGGAVSGRVGRGGVTSAFGMWQGKRGEAGAETERRGMRGADARRRRVWGFSFVFCQGRLGGPEGMGCT